MIDWNEALRISVVAFAGVFITLGILMSAIKLTGVFTKKLTKVENTKEE